MLLVEYTHLCGHIASNYIIANFSIVLAVEPIVPSITTQQKSDGHIHAIVTVYPNADNIGCKM